MATQNHPAKPFILGLGGGANPGSSTEQALQIALRGAQELGARVRLIGAASIMSLPLYRGAERDRPAEAAELIAALRAADGLIIASPAYHGCVSGAVKNSLDYLQETARDLRPYLTGMPVGLVAVAGGYQGAMVTIQALRSIVHSLRGWPAPLAGVVNSNATPFSKGHCADAKVEEQLLLVGRQVVQFLCERSYQILQT